MSRKFNTRLLSLVLAVLMVLSCMPAMAEGTAVPEGYKQVAESSAFKLYLLEETMAVIIQSKESGELLYSTVQDANTGNKTWKGFYQSGIVMEYLEDVKDKPIQADFINNASEITYEYADTALLPMSATRISASPLTSRSGWMRKACMCSSPRIPSWKRRIRPS